ncbi:hypothetical protein ACFFNY_34195 [Paenibacillus hodogayensis]|uniref:Phosphoribosyl-AMP cyclohydrolase n=1 Tax=Paenibacillus hodogayensis TaxID=279208 RepID=A0ABV5W7V9_9BACL
MECSKSLILLTEPERHMVVLALMAQSRTMANPYESEMYRWLAKKVWAMESQYRLDGQELIMIALSLNKEADRCELGAAACLHRRLSRRIWQEKVKFHKQAYAELASRYLF